MENTNSILSMIDKIAAGEVTDARDDFNALIAPKLQDALNARKAEIAASLYATEVEQEQPSEEETVEDEPEQQAN